MSRDMYSQWHPFSGGILVCMLTLMTSDALSTRYKKKKSMTHKLNAEWTSSRGSGRGFHWEGLILETKNARLKLRIGLVLPFLREEKHLQRARKHARARVHAH